MLYNCFKTSHEFEDISIIFEDTENDFYIFNNGNEIIFEGWCGSTKHPAIQYSFDDYSGKLSFDKSFDANVASWLLYIASRMLWKHDRIAIAKIALMFDERS